MSPSKPIYHAIGLSHDNDHDPAHDHDPDNTHPHDHDFDPDPNTDPDHDFDPLDKQIIYVSF